MRTGIIEQHHRRGTRPGCRWMARRRVQKPKGRSATERPFVQGRI